MGEAKIAAHRRRLARGEKTSDRRLALVAQLRALRRAEDELANVEDEMAKMAAYGATAPEIKADTKLRILRQRIPDIDRDSVDAGALRMVHARDGRPLLVEMADGSSCRFDGRRIRFWGGASAESQAARIATAIAEAEAVDDVEYLSHSARVGSKRRERRADGTPTRSRQLRVDEAEEVAARWRARGFSHVDVTPTGVWIDAGRCRLRDTGDWVEIYGDADPAAVRALCAKAREDWNGSMVLEGSEAFKRACWIEAKRQGVEIVDWDPPRDLVERWEAERKDANQAKATVQATADDAAQARDLQELARGEPGRGLVDAKLQAFFHGYADQDPEQARRLAEAKPGDLVPEMGRFRYYGGLRLDPANGQRELAAWLKGGDAPPPGCADIAESARRHFAITGDAERAATHALRPLGVVQDDGQLRTAEEMRKDIASRKSGAARPGGRPGARPEARL
jgi:hypothetical protein